MRSLGCQGTSARKNQKSCGSCYNLKERFEGLLYAHKVSMNGLPREMVWCVLECADPVTQIVCACVNGDWHGMTRCIRRNPAHLCKRACCAKLGTDSHSPCLRPRRCAIRYAKRALDQRRWSIFEWMADRTGPKEGINDADMWACTVAAADGDLQRLKSMIKRRWYRTYGDEITCAAASYGRASVLEWLKQNQGQEWDAGALYGAIRGGHLDVARWMLQTEPRDQPWAAARYGHMDILREHVHQGRNSVKDSRWAMEAARGGRTDVLDWLREHCCDICHGVAERAAAKGHTSVIQWFAAGGGRLSSWEIAYAAEKGHREVVEWLLETHPGRVDIKWAYVQAVQAGHLALAQHLYKRTHYRSAYACARAVKNGHLHVVRWCMSKGQHYAIEEMISVAARRGHIHILEWLHAWWQGTIDGACPTMRVRDPAMVAMAKRGHTQTLEWLDAHGITSESDMWTLQGSVKAARGGHVRVLAWMRARGLPWNDKGCMLEAASRGDLDLIEWLVAQGCAWDERACVGAAINKCYVTVGWLYAHGAPLDRTNYALGIWSVRSATEWAEDSGWAPRC